MMRFTILLFALSMNVSVLAETDASTSTPLDDAFRRFWQAEDREQAAAAAQAIVATSADFDQVFARLEAGRPYSRQVKTGRLDLSHKISGGVRHHYRVLVPKDYDPEKRYPVRFYLHGGVARPAWRKGGGWWSNYARFEDPGRISVFPSSWESSMWWQRRQAENLPMILDRLQRTYNLDENAAHMIGISDGATGAYFFALRAPTPWASFLPFIGHPAVLGNRRVGADGEMYMRNVFGKPFFVVNGGRDRLYPVARVLPFLDLMHRAGAEIDFHPQPEGGHDTSWWPAEAENIRAFIEAHRRDPLPERLTWETERTDRYHRVHWLLITELGEVEGESRLDDVNTLVPPPSANAQPEGQKGRGAQRVEAFPRAEPSGRVELAREGNVIRVRTQGVARYTLLLSPREVDFGRPITVITNGRQSWSGLLAPDVGTLLAWAARDNDRSMLFGAELEIEL